MRIWEYPLKIQTYNSENQQWGHREFATQKEFIGFMEEQFKLPGQYKLHHVENFQIEGLKYSEAAKQSKKPNFEGGVYTKAIKNTQQWKKYWATEKDKVLKGVIIDEFYLPPFYYWYLNYCPIFDALLGKKRLPDVWDSDLWYFHYCMLAILKGKHIGGVKGRQKGYSYKHMAILYWSYCWFENSVNTIGAYTEDLVKKSWRFLEGYRKHLNSTFSAWKRGPTQPKSLEWNEVTMGADNNPYGLQSKLVGVTFKQSPSNDVGGSQTFFNYEEPGVSPTLLETLEFVRPALERGTETTGTIIACGSVGDLDDAEGLRKIFYNPEDYNFLPVKNIWDTKNESERCCIFISEAYNMDGTDDITGKPFMDENGNSDVDLAMTWIGRHEEKIRKSSKSAELKQLQLSQKCISPEQAFAQRKVSEFPIELLKKQQERIELKNQTDSWEFKPVKGLYEDVNGRPTLNTRNLPPEHRYPINPDWEDKRGVWTIYEPPDENAEFYTYFACVDAIEVDQTDTSASVASVDIFKTAVHVIYEKDSEGREKSRIEGDKLVANYRGRFETARKTNEQIWLGIKAYNAFTYAERNKPNFINYMREMGVAERYLAKEQDVPMFKDLNIKNGNALNNSKFGFHKGDNTEIWKYFKAYAKEYFHTEFGRSTFTKNGEEEVLKIFTGIDRIDDYWLLEEFIKYVEVKGKIKGNYDRLVSFMGALFICKIYQQNRFIKKRNEIREETPKNTYKPPRSINMLGGGMRIPIRQPGRKPTKPRSIL